MPPWSWKTKCWIVFPEEWKNPEFRVIKESVIFRTAVLSGIPMMRKSAIVVRCQATKRKRSVLFTKRKYFNGKFENKLLYSTKYKGE